MVFVFQLLLHLLKLFVFQLLFQNVLIIQMLLTLLYILILILQVLQIKQLLLFAIQLLLILHQTTSLQLITLSRVGLGFTYPNIHTGVTINFTSRSFYRQHFYYLLPSFYVTIFQKYVTLLYVLMYKMCYKLHNLMCFYPI